jgi:hypothetical protein
MVRHAISQTSVLDGSRIIGTTTEENIISNLGADLRRKGKEHNGCAFIRSFRRDTSLHHPPLLEKHREYQ